MNTFKPGDLIIGQNFTINTEMNGAEGLVTSALEESFIVTSAGQDLVYAHQVEWESGEISWQEPRNLRHKKPPQTGENKVIELFKPTIKETETI